MHRKSFRKPRAEQGLTLIETLLVLVILAIVAGLAIIFYQQASQSQRAKAAQDQVLQLIAAVRSLIPGPNYAGLNGSILIQAGKVPSNMVSGTNIINTFGAQVTVAPATVNSIANAGFTVTYPGVGRSECNTLVGTMHPQFHRVVVGTTTLKDIDTATNNTAPGQIATACDNDVNTLALTVAG